MRNKKHKAKLDKIYKLKKQKLNGENTITELRNKIETETLIAGKKAGFNISHECHIFYSDFSWKKGILEITEINIVAILSH